LTSPGLILYRGCMNFREWIGGRDAATPFIRSIAALTDVYDELDRLIESFARASATVCPPDCGKCCDDFVPDTTPPEADLIALYLYAARRDLLERITNKPGRTCPLFEPQNPLHCSIYPVRPLICRTFGFSAYLDKREKEVFRYCVHMGGRTVREKEFEHVLRARPPVARRYGARLSALTAGREARRPLPSAVEASLTRVDLWFRYGSDIPA
jgi:uncharacterized protein